ncbi:MAG: DHH family phosphoesterase [Spirochaetia bacterium]|jgi:exopolyphosphatase|nr:DHH family phosphoesterase [Spirochaetia bacterium]
MGNDMMSWLQGLKNNFSKQKQVSIVMGNEAADLDSMASAVCYAWYLHLDDPSQNSFPLINIPRADFKLRTEAVYLFQEAGVNIDDLLFTEDIDLEKLKAAGTLKLVLVDHNKLASSQTGLERLITGIIDHHADEAAYPPAAVTDIKPVGSCATIVAENFLKDQQDTIEKSLGTLLLGTILLDTVNLDPEAGRVTNDDSKAANKIIEISGLDSKKLFDKLQFEKFNVSSLGSYDLLRKDYKEWQMGSVKLGIGSVLLPASDWAAKDPDIANECDRYLKEHKLDVLLAMNAFTSPGFTRQLVVYVPDGNLRSKTVTFLEGSDLGLEKLEINSSSDGCTFYNQKNLGISRKKLQPLLKEFFEG